MNYIPRSMALLLAGLVCASAQIPQAIQDVKSWQITYTISAVAHGERQTPGAAPWQDTWDFHSSASGHGTLTEQVGHAFQGLSTTMVQGSSSAKHQSMTGPDVYYDQGSFSGAPAKQGVFKSVLYLGKDGYNLDIGTDSMLYQEIRGYSDLNGDHRQNVQVGFHWTPIFTGPYAYPASGTTLSLKGKMNGDFLLSDVFSVNKGIEYSYTIIITPIDTAPLKLELTADGYDDWRPTANLDGKPGDGLKFNAKLIHADGTACSATVATWSWKLEGTSREPGIALNWPMDADDKEYDLRLDAGELTLHDDTLQWVDRPNPDPELRSDSMEVKPYDWGGWSTLSVKAKLLDGRVIEGEFKPTGEKTVRIPKRAKDSYIADVWKKGKSVGADMDDRDGKPTGDGTAGDGLTNYEEYRGFYEDGQHIEGDPGVKDFFVRDRTAALAVPGIQLFGRISGLKVHYKLKISEIPGDRVMNKNHAAGPHAVDQHAVTLDVSSSQGGFSIANGGPGTPKSITSVMLAKDAGTWSRSELKSTVAHELLHCVNVWHHGETDDNVVWRPDTLAPTPGGLLENGYPIKLMLESGEDMTAVLNNYLVDNHMESLDARQGVPQGQHSGFDNCVMRYDDAWTYAAASDANKRYYVREEPGMALCKSAAGAGVNADGRRPQSRYFHAASGRGNCSTQILVNDKATAPSR